MAHRLVSSALVAIPVVPIIIVIVVTVGRKTRSAKVRSSGSFRCAILLLLAACTLQSTVIVLSERALRPAVY